MVNSFFMRFYALCKKIITFELGLKKSIKNGIQIFTFIG
ncbi:hypothetical protein KL86DYS1_11146 [uncultured Dysgonomonas sp.]|uniref:Uncharacterized protein n=1 Tax=uncultured Dysgonomonas sp. TaxID=206096 RepID=A0A212J4W6_9BACT|nr:hypothetical protein KL86DYS1_11146 [uncultured Dysgonomonas sp.]